MSLLGSAGFDLYSSDPEHLTSQLSTLTSPILSPLSKGLDDDSSIHLLDLSSTPSTAISTESGAVLTRSRSSTDASSASRLRKTTSSIVSSSSESEETETELATAKASPEVRDGQPASVGSKHHHLYRSQSHSPSGCDVQILDPDLTCIGLQDDNADVWGLKRTADGKWSWEKATLKEGSEVPQPRGWFAADITENGQLVVQGGLNENNERIGDAWVLTVEEA